MSIDDLLKTRRSIRNYTKEYISEEKVMEIIEAGTWAPTACNKQEYRFIYFDNNSSLIKIQELGAAHFLKNCQQAILVLYDNRIDNLEYRDDLQSAAATIQNMILKAHDLNIGTCWVCNLPSKAKLREKFKIPKNYDPIALITLGYYDYKPSFVKRKKDLKEIVFINEFDVKRNIKDEKSNIKLFIRKYLRILYLRVPKTGLIKKLASIYEKRFDN